MHRKREACESKFYA